jgi:hypothetical protein
LCGKYTPSWGADFLAGRVFVVFLGDPEERHREPDRCSGNTKACFTTQISSASVKGQFRFSPGFATPSLVQNGVAAAEIFFSAALVPMCWSFWLVYLVAVFPMLSATTRPVSLLSTVEDDLEAAFRLKRLPVLATEELS